MTPEQFKADIIEFAKLATQISEGWNEIQNTHPELNDRMCDDYPFQHSFDEMASRINTWAENAK